MDERLPMTIDVIVDLNTHRVSSVMYNDTLRSEPRRWEAYVGVSRKKKREYGIDKDSVAVLKQGSQTVEMRIFGKHARYALREGYPLSKVSEGVPQTILQYVLQPPKKI